MENVQVRCSDAGCGLFAAKRFKKGSVMLTVPEDLTLASPVHAEERLDANGMVQLTLLDERAKGSTSKWGPYISMLPSEVAPVFSMTEEDMQVLNGTQTWTTFQKFAGAMHGQTRDLCAYGRTRQAAAHQMPPSAFQLRACQWAVSMMKSRAFSVRSSSMQDAARPAFIPVIDMMNHAHDGYSIEPCQGVCTYKAHKDLEVGDELIINYGKFLSGPGAVQYGFVMQPAAVLPVWPDERFIVNNNDELAQFKGQLAADQGCYSSGAGMIELAEAAASPEGFDPFYQKLLSCERIWAMDARLIERFNLNEQLDFSAPVDAENEVTALLFMKYWLKHWPSKHATATTIEEDAALVSSLPYGNQRLMVELRLAEKRFFLRMTAKANTCLADLGMADL